MAGCKRCTTVGDEASEQEKDLDFPKRSSWPTDLLTINRESGTSSVASVEITKALISLQ